MIDMTEMMFPHKLAGLALCFVGGLSAFCGCCGVMCDWLCALCVDMRESGPANWTERASELPLISSFYVCLYDILFWFGYASSVGKSVSLNWAMLPYIMGRTSRDALCARHDMVLAASPNWTSSGHKRCFSVDGR